jgi:hypothetical protein
MTTIETTGERPHLEAWKQANLDGRPCPICGTTAWTVREPIPAGRPALAAFGCCGCPAVRTVPLDSILQTAGSVPARPVECPV